MKKRILFTLLVVAACLQLGAQRSMELLDRGLVAVKVTNGVYLSWRMLGEEWYDVTYNVYRDGTKLNAEPLTTSNYSDASGTTASTYTVAAVVRGVEQEPCAAVSTWSQQYIDIPMANILDANGNNINSLYSLNDANAADLDGDGVYEIIVKRQNTDFKLSNTAYTLFQAYKLDGTLLWTINMGPNLINAGHVETNCMAFDFNEDGKAEVVFRATDGTILPDGTVVGNATVNYRDNNDYDANLKYQIAGDEWIYVLEGATGAVIDSEKFDADATNGNNLARRTADFWGDGTGHRCNKFYFGAPYLDGRHPSIYLGRGCYTNVHMAAWDLVNNKLVLRWTYACDDGGSKYYGQGYHNYSIVDVDLDGRDEICHGNMVIDDDGTELSSTGLGHGDAQHYGDLDPYRKGMEGFRCLESNPGAVLVDAATNEILLRWIRGRDNGRCNAGNFTDDFPGAELWTTDGHLWSATTSRAADQIVASTAPGVTMNFRIYWDGDILEEGLDGGTDTDASVYKYGNTAAIFTTSGCSVNNGTKATPSLQADLFGDWREEILVRTKDNSKLRIYTTTIPTAHRNYTLMHDMQYRQAIYWQMCGYNQPPHVSYFLGNAEGITVPPPPLTNLGRVEITDNTLSTAENDKHVLLANTTGHTQVTVAEGAKPYILTVSSPARYTLSGAAFSGEMRLIKQGQGLLTFSGDHTYTGVTELWDGVTAFDGSLQSPVWMNRFAELNTTAIYNKGIEMEYGAILRAGGADNKGTVTASSLKMKAGAVAELDIYSDDFSADLLKVNGTLTLAEGTIFRFVHHNRAGESQPAVGRYLIAEAATLEGALSGVVVEGMLGISCSLENEEGKIYLVVADMRAAANVVWSGVEEGAIWNLNATKNFLAADGTADVFATGDNVVFDETAVTKTVTLEGSLSPTSVTVKGGERYTIQGEGSISGNAVFVKEGEGVLTVTNLNSYTGGTRISGGTVSVSQLATEQSVGNLGALSSEADKFILENGATLSSSNEVFNESAIKMGEGGGTIYTAGTFHQKGAVEGTTLVKGGSGTLKLYGANKYKKLIVNSGYVDVAQDGSPVGDTIVLNGGTFSDYNSMGSYSSQSWHVVVPEGKTAYLNLDGRCDYKGTLTGAGKVTVQGTDVRCYLSGDWSKFEGTVVATHPTTGASGYDTQFYFNNTYGLPKATLEIASGKTVYNNAGGTFPIAILSGTGSLAGTSTTWAIGNDFGKNSSFGGTIDGTVNKVGASVLTLSAKNSISGGLNVYGGIVRASATAGTATGTGLLTIYDGGTVDGRGIIGNSRVAIKEGGILEPGYVKSGQLTVNCNINQDAGGILQFWLRRNSTCTSISMANKVLVLKGTVRCLMHTGYTDPAVGDEFVLWEAKSINANSNPTIELPELPEGLAWDTADLLKPTGILRVKAADDTGVNVEAMDEVVTATVFNLSGLPVAEFACPYDRVDEQLNASTLDNGVYLVRMKGKNGVGTKKMIKQ